MSQSASDNRFKSTLVELRDRLMPQRSMFMCVLNNVSLSFFRIQLFSRTNRIFTNPRKMATQRPIELTDGRASGEERYTPTAFTWTSRRTSRRSRSPLWNTTAGNSYAARRPGLNVVLCGDRLFQRCRRLCENGTAAAKIFAL